MPTNLVAAPQWVNAITPAGADLVSHANMATVLQTHADRQEFTHLRNALQLRMLPVADPSTVFGAVVHDRAGQIVLVGATTFARVGLGYPSAIGTPGSGYGLAYQQGVALAGAPTLTPLVRGAYDGANYAVFASGGYAYVFTQHHGSGGRYAFTGITTARDILWSPYSNFFLATGDGEIESSAGGVTWATEYTSGYDFRLIACDVTGQYVLAAPYASDDWAYSSNGGGSWTTVAAKAIGGDSSYTVTGLAYDDSRGVWLATFDGGTFIGDATRVWYVADPVAGTWAVSGASIPNYGLDLSDTAYARSVVVYGSTWIVGSEGSATTDGNIWLSPDAGVTWEIPVGYGASGPVELRRTGSYITFGNATSVEAISGRIWD